MSIKNWIENNTNSLSGKKIAVTGSTGGLGKWLCLYLASLGASIVLVSRNEKRSKEQRAELLEKFDNVSVECLELDLENVSSACETVKRLIDLEIDVFIHNAGAYSIPRHKCESGFDNVFQINFATPYYMIRKLLPHLRARNGKVVVVGSIAHNYSKIDENDVDFSTHKASSKVYGNSKRYLMFALYELFKNERYVELAVCHPGISFTNITAHYPKVIFAIIKNPMKVIFMKPKKACLSVLKGVFENTSACEWIGPGLFDVWGYPKKKTLKTCKTEEQRKIAEIAEKVFAQCEKTVL